MALPPDSKITSIEEAGRRREVLAHRDQLVTEHLPLVAAIAKSVHRNLPPQFELDDLIQTGYFALVRVATRYRPKDHNGCPFSAYARHRIRGAMLDSTKRGRYVEQTRESIDSIPSAGSVAEALVVSTEKRLLLGALKRHSTEARGEAAIDRAELLKRLDVAITRLSTRQQKLIRRYYREDVRHLKQLHWKRRRDVTLNHHQILQILRRELSLMAISREPGA